MTRHWMRFLAGATCSVLLLLSAAAATGAPGQETQPGSSPTTAQLTWTSFLRLGPGLQYAVTDEIAGGDSVDVLGCADGWCRVVSGRATGYLEADRLLGQGAAATPANPAGAPKTPPACFEARLSGYGRGDLTRFCDR